MRFILFVFASVAIFLASTLTAQTKKELTLSDAVLKQHSELGPKKVRGLAWLNETSYIFNKGKGEEGVIYAFDLKKNRERVVLTMADYKEAMTDLEIEVKSLPRFRRVGNNLLVFQVESSYFLFSASKGKYQSYENETEGISDVHFSKDGTYMTYVKEYNIYLKELGGELKQITKDGSFDVVYGKAASRSEFGISSGIFWADSDFGFAYYRNDQTEVTTYPLVDLTKTPAELFPIKYPMAGGKSEIVTLELYNRDLGTVKIQTTPEEDAYICSVNWTPNGEEIILVTLNRDQNHAKFQRFSSKTGALIGLEYEEKDEKYVEPLFPLIFTKEDGSEYVYLSQKDGWMHAYFKNREGEKQLTKGEWVITKYLGMNEEKKAMYFEGTGDDPTENQIYMVDMESATFKKISKNQGTYHAKLSPGGKYMITYFSNVETPGKTLVADADGIVIKSLLISSDPLEEYNVARPELLNITNEEGIILHARMIKPHDFDENKKYPVLVYVYNGPHVQLVKNRWWGSAPLWMNYLAEKGYIVFTVDGRGSYNRGKEFEQYIFKNVGDFEMLDQIAGAEYLKSLPFVDGEKMAVHGWSYGGFMTVSLMLHHPDYFKVGVAGGPVTNWKYYEIMYTERYMDTPETNPEGFMKTDLTNHVVNLKGKLMLIHGLSDDVVVPQHNFTLIKKFVDEGIQVDFFPYPGHPHNVRGKDRLHLMQKVLTYIEDNL